jgi:Asp-tRNA(Asn)/Glu-tRNA(Gln) amidotransferase A subunit family amidase
MDSVTHTLGTTTTTATSANGIKATSFKNLRSNNSAKVNFAATWGAPSITLPTGHVDNMPWCINLNCKHGDDQKLLNAALRLEQIFNFYKEDK